ncbi:40S ribosomal protein S29 [Dictyostelium discoideum AX4]|uniref:Small ribosomal subunit protein uS14 n=1 Tax=Dictyostelium discoideum TaxID=44689 RepID=RS29_DICDI|nr:40S ribosomal protein S29 [Dictyostelium discoideum AX4]Q76P36.1 RecName: Full=Small ribosomal subunit protein uS14; AltName: Full=40S ribosomal protein S29 [Dictyostelium discoideum]EAL71306.1 40S ribosomal protein S29 [Dictyostelium discoideum AX4]|eukprot:XP_645130.1 40S ribosomal protein S29 [Dictyostelium discoideum AX4]
MARELWLTHPRNFGPGSRTCRKCGNHHGIIRKYDLNMCRRCFRTDAEAIGFNKYR